MARPHTTGRFESRKALEGHVIAMLAAGNQRREIRKDCQISEGSLQGIVKKQQREKPEDRPKPLHLLPPGAESRGSWITPNMGPTRE